eukprot:UN33837
MTLDEELARYVNLKPMRKRGDIYSVVQEHVRKCVVDPDKRFMYGFDYTPEAEMIKDHITRKLVKTTVMTSVYGVTAFGARRQISEALKEMVTKGQLCLPDEYENGEYKDWLKSLSSYLGKLTYDSIGEVTCPAYLSMMWLRDCARKVSEDGHKIMWLTPLDLPCTQHYAKQKNTNV